MAAELHVKYCPKMMPEARETQRYQTEEYSNSSTRKAYVEANTLQLSGASVRHCMKQTKPLSRTLVFFTSIEKEPNEPNVVSY